MPTSLPSQRLAVDTSSQGSPQLEGGQEFWGARLSQQRLACPPEGLQAVGIDQAWMEKAMSFRNRLEMKRDVFQIKNWQALLTAPYLGEK